MSFPRYPAYKDSGVAWLGEVPAHWQIVRNKVVFREVDERSVSDEGELLTVSHITGVTRRADKDVNMFMAETLEGYKLCRQGDLVINTMWAWMGALGMSPLDGLVSPSYNVYRPRSPGTLLAAYYDYLCRIPSHRVAIKAHSSGVWESRLRLYPDAFLGMFMVVPSAAEQRLIVAFLEREIAEIDTIIRGQTQLRDLLHEKRQALVSHSITRGCNPESPTRNSGIDWLGHIPSHWSVSLVKYAIDSIEQGWSPQCEADPRTDESEWGVLKVGCVNGGMFDGNENKALPAHLEPIPSLSIRAGDILMSRANSPDLVGSVALVESNHPRLLLCDKLYRIRPNRKIVDEGFLALYLGSEICRTQAERTASGASSSMVNISQSFVLNLPVAIPPLDEQRAIVGTVKQAMEATKTTIDDVQHAITLLQERRSALIAAAVTGKIDVRQLTAEGQP